MRHSLLSLVVAAAGVLLTPSSGYSLGTRVPDQDAEATARGDAFTATADNPSAIFYNPAGITQLDGLTARIGGYGILIHEHYTPLSDLNGEHASTNHQEPQVVPQMYLAYHPKALPFAFGVGIYAPFGFNIEYPDDASFRAAGLDGKLQFLDVNPVFAVQVTRSLSIALGISADYVNAELRQGLSSMPGDSFTFKGSGLTVGGNAGILWKPSPRQSIGLSYHSPVGAGLKGHDAYALNNTERAEAEAGNRAIAAGKAALNAGIREIQASGLPPAEQQVLIAKANAAYQAGLAAAGVPASGSFPTSLPTLGAEGNLHFPQFAVLGYSFRPTPEWNFETDIDWTDWDSLNTVTLNQVNKTTVKVPFNWRHSFLYEVGVTRLIGPYRLSAGYVYSENSVPTGSFNPVIPDGARDIFSVGVGRTFGQYSVDVAYQLTVGPTRTVVNNSVSDGHYSFSSNAVTLSVGCHY